jgi:hypothetical protein
MIIGIPVNIFTNVISLVEIEHIGGYFVVKRIQIEYSEQQINKNESKKGQNDQFIYFVTVYLFHQNKGNYD